MLFEIRGYSKKSYIRCLVDLESLEKRVIDLRKDKNRELYKKYCEEMNIAISVYGEGVDRTVIGIAEKSSKYVTLNRKGNIKVCKLSELGVGRVYVFTACGTKSYRITYNDTTRIDKRIQQLRMIRYTNY